MAAAAEIAAMRRAIAISAAALGRTSPNPPWAASSSARRAVSWPRGFMSARARCTPRRWRWRQPGTTRKAEQRSSRWSPATITGGRPRAGRLSLMPGSGEWSSRSSIRPHGAKAAWRPSGRRASALKSACWKRRPGSSLAPGSRPPGRPAVDHLALPSRRQPHHCSRRCAADGGRLPGQHRRCLARGLDSLRGGPRIARQGRAVHPAPGGQ
jgi:hypothetical protein